MGIYYAEQNIDVVTGRKKDKEEKTGNEVGKGSVKSEEAENSNTWKCIEPVNLAKSYLGPVTVVTLHRWV